MASGRTRTSRDPFRFDSALQERVEHSKFETTQRLGPHDPEEAALDADEGLTTSAPPEPLPDAAERGWVIVDGRSYLPAPTRPRRRRVLRWLLPAAALGVAAMLAMRSSR